MLVNFNVQNFLSFNEKQSFSMIGGKVRGKANHLTAGSSPKLLKFASIFGANASGKSNIVTAMDFARDVILDGFPSDCTLKYCRTFADNKDKPSRFEFEIFIKGKCYVYGFEIILYERSILAEWLFEVASDKRRKEIFVRNIKEKDITLGGHFKDKEVLNKLTVYADAVKSDDTVLFLTEMNRNKNDLYQNNPEFSVLRTLFRWFERVLDINYPNKPFSSYSYFMMDDKASEIADIIAAFDTGIRNFRVINTSLDELAAALPRDLIKEILNDLEKEVSRKRKEGKSNKDIGGFLRGEKEFYILGVNEEGDPNIKTLEFEHGNQGAYLGLSEESDGTRRILELIELLFAAKNGANKVYVIDEIDRSLHPMLTYKLVESYLNLDKQSKMQIIVTTHESRLLDLELLRRDEIWFVNKNKDGESVLYSLDAYNERFDKKIDKAYLDGVYGGIPRFDEIVPFVIE